MKMLSEVVTPSLRDQLHEIEGDIAQDMTIIMREEASGLKEELRQQVTGAGMGARLARTWQAQVYPKGGRSLNPAGYVYSKAPQIIQAFTDGATIRPVNGGKWLWIPTGNVPARRRAGNYVSSMRRRANGTKMTPEEVELHFNAELDVVIEGGKGLAFIDVVAGLRGGYRQATAGRVAGRRKAEPVLMFTLVKAVKMPRLLELDAPARRAAARIARRMADRWS
ncbi:MAG: DUF6441 family protein [Pseudomonadota bacterium]|nr:DUF6441 family protein [Pseudomonadota bacterium]